VVITLYTPAKHYYIDSSSVDIISFHVYSYLFDDGALQESPASAHLLPARTSDQTIIKHKGL
jgi:hypothetical protein